MPNPHVDRMTSRYITCPSSPSRWTPPWPSRQAFTWGGESPFPRSHSRLFSGDLQKIQRQRASAALGVSMKLRAAARGSIVVATLAVGTFGCGGDANDATAETKRVASPTAPMNARAEKSTVRPSTATMGPETRLPVGGEACGPGGKPARASLRVCRHRERHSS